MWRGCVWWLERRNGQDGDGYGISWWEDNTAHITLGTDPNAPLAYDSGLELHHPIMSTLGGNGGQLERERGGGGQSKVASLHIFMSLILFSGRGPIYCQSRRRFIKK